MKICERNNSADTKVSEEGAREDAPVARAEVPLQPTDKTVVRQVVPLQPMEVHGGAAIHLQPMEDPMLEQVDAPRGGCDPMGRGAHAEASLLAGLLTPWEDLMLQKFMEDCLLWWDLMLEQGKRVRRKERQRQCVMI